MAEVLKAARLQRPFIERAKHSFAPISERMSSPRGKVAAIVTGVMALLGGLLKLLVDAGVLR